MWTWEASLFCLFWDAQSLTCMMSPGWFSGEFVGVVFFFWRAKPNFLNHPQYNHHFYRWYKPSQIIGLWGLWHFFHDRPRYEAPLQQVKPICRWIPCKCLHHISSLLRKFTIWGTLRWESGFQGVAQAKANMDSMRLASMSILEISSILGCASYLVSGI